MNVTVKYNLSQAGQRAALIAGRTATAKVTETMSFDDPSLVENLTIQPDGTIHLDACGSYTAWGDETLTLDAPPADLAALLSAVDENKAKNKLVRDEREALVAERSAKEVAAKRQKAAYDFPIVEGILAEVEALPLDADISTLVAEGVRVLIQHYSGTFQYLTTTRDARGYTYELTPEQAERFKVLIAARHQYEKELAAKKQKEKEAEASAMIAEHGGIVFPVEGGMCDFKGRNLWSNGQTKRWVGVFTAPKGIDTFLSSPRGEDIFSVVGLKRGDCIQGAGYDTNSRGKRRNESEWFGAVVRNDENEIVVSLCDSRAATMKAAAKLK